MKKFSLLESLKYSSEEIEDFFIEYVDTNRFTIKDGFIDSDKRFFTDVSHVDKRSKE